MTDDTKTAAERARELVPDNHGYFEPPYMRELLIKAITDTDTRVREEYFADWKPISSAINALPDPLRKFIHDLETMCDPSGMVQEITMLREQVIGSEKEILNLREESKALTAAAIKEAMHIARRAGADHVSDLIEGLLCADAQAALDRHVAVAVQKEREECLQLMLKVRDDKLAMFVAIDWFTAHTAVTRESEG